MKWWLVLVSASTFVTLAGTPSPADERSVCSAAAGERPVVPGVRVEDASPRSDDLPALKVTSAATGAHMFVYYDAGSEGVARSRAACFGKQLGLLAEEMRDARRSVEWQSVVFTQDAAYISPSVPGLKVRWRMLVDQTGTLSPDVSRLTLDLIPHEQVHDYQGREDAVLPRWFSEGHATWVALRVTAAIDASSARATKERLARDLSESSSPLKLSEWGSVQPRREAILRQVSAEDRLRMEEDPDFMPPGPFTFTSADLIGDESNMPARYAAALAVFEGLEARHGPATVHAWAEAVTRSQDPAVPDSLARSVERYFGETMETLLRDP